MHEPSLVVRRPRHNQLLGMSELVSRRISSGSLGSTSSTSSSNDSVFSKQSPSFTPALIGQTQYRQPIIGHDRNICTCHQMKWQQELSTEHRIMSEGMHCRPLPAPPGETQKRYQNDSPFRITRTEPRRHGSTSSSSSGGSNMKEDLEDDLLKQVPWFHKDISRDRVMEVLSKEDIGSFLVRSSTSQNGCFALSVKVPKFDNPTGIAHYLIHRTPSGGVRLKGLEKEWSNLSSLVVHHTIMPELLPCTLKMPRGVSRRSLTPRGSGSSSNINNNNNDPRGASSPHEHSSRSLNVSAEINQNTNSHSNVNKLSTQVKNITIH